MSVRPAPLRATGVLDQALEERPDAEALVARSGRLIYRELDQWANRSAHALSMAGVRPGDRVGVCLPNDLLIVGLFHAVMRLGAIWVGVNAPLAPPEKAYILGDCGASLLIAEDEVVDQLGPHRRELSGLAVISAGGGRNGQEWSDLLDSIPADPGPVEGAGPVDPLAPAAIAYTSGTTGFPKGAIHSQHNLMLPGAVLNQTRHYGPALRKADCFALTILNLQVLSTLLVAQAGGTAIVMDRTDPVGIAEWIAAERPTTFNGAPAMFHGLVAREEVTPAHLASLDDVWTGGSHCPAELHHRFFEKFGRPLRATYGATEVPTVVSIQPRVPAGALDDVTTSGPPLPHLDAAVLDDHGRAASTGAVGEIGLRAAATGPWAGCYRPMLGYWERPDASAAALRDGWFHTGDLGSLDHRGRLAVSDRQASVIQRGGANVYPAEVERVIDRYPGVRASCVVGVPDERLGARIVAMVEAADPEKIDPEAVAAHCRAQLARYKVPERFVFGALPRNSMSKVSRRAVEAALAEISLPGR